MRGQRFRASIPVASTTSTEPLAPVVPPAAPYEPPADWLALPTLVPGDKKFIGLYAVLPSPATTTVSSPRRRTGTVHRPTPHRHSRCPHRQTTRPKPANVRFTPHCIGNSDTLS